MPQQQVDRVEPVAARRELDELVRQVDERGDREEQRGDAEPGPVVAQPRGAQRSRRAVER
jgi:hypothetical protein